MKQKTVFVCQNCGYQSPRWAGQCPECSEWNTLVEQVALSKKEESRANAKSALVRTDFESLYEVIEKPKRNHFRISTRIGEFDRVLGTSALNSGESIMGLVPGSVILVAGEPGIGKSTLVTQTILNILMNGENNVNNIGVAGDSPDQSKKKVLYVNGEENANQIAERIERVYKKYSGKEGSQGQVNDAVKTQISRQKTKTSTSDEYNSTSKRDWMKDLLFLDTTNVDEICSTVSAVNPLLVVVDSIQTMKTEDLTGTAGSFGQLKESTQRITETVKKLGIPCILIGHVTKEGTIAGPKVLEHIVDGVFELSGERTGEVRVLRAIKNRFGATDEVGLFLIDEDGLKELTNPSEIFLQQGEQKVPGSAIVCTLEGTRPLLLETQALVLESQLPMPRRVAQGISMPRMQVLTAVLQKHGRIPLGNCDVFVNVAGGFQIKEPAADLGIALAMVSSQKNIPLPPNCVFIGEVGLLGEVREVPFLKRRIKEAKRLGFEKVISSQTHKHITQVIGQLFGKR